MSNYIDKFSNPPAEFRGAPFWAWNCKLDKQTLLKQIDYFKEMGMGGFTMHCRVGLDTEYLGEEFMDIVKACVTKAKALKMKAYLYDEDRWPSGSCGGKVTKDPRYRGRRLVFSPHERESGSLLAVYEVELSGGYLKSYKKINSGAARGEKSDVWYAYLEINGDDPWYNNQAYLNTLDKSAVEKFIEETHEKYNDEVGNEFGKTIPSIFTDEPQFVFKDFFGKANEKRELSIPYTDDFEDTFKALYNESFLAKLPEIFWELPDGEISAARYRYHAHLTERFSQAFCDTVGAWCDEHGIKLTGHMMEEPSLHSQTRAIGEAMSHYRGFQVPGIDMLCDWREYTTAKQAQSAAHQFGRNEVTSELYGVTNWNFDFRGHKLQGDWQAALGVTHRVHHLSWVSMEGEAKRDYPASIFYQSPWYKKYETLETYFARINTAMQSGSPNVRVGVIHPIESYWLHYGPDEQTSVVRSKLQNRFDQITEWLLFGLIDFDFISEAILETDKPKDGEGFTVGCMKYDVVIVPGCETLRSSTVKRLDDFIKSGGRVVFMGEAPKYINALPSDEPKGLYEKASRVDFDYSSLMSELEAYRSVDIRDCRGNRAGRYIYQLRNAGDEKYLFAANARRAENKDIPRREDYTVEIAGEYTVEEMDPFSGEIKPLNAEYINGKTVIRRGMYECDSLLLRLKRGAGAQSGAVTAENGEWRFVRDIKTADDYALSEPNVVMLDQAECSLDGGEFMPCEEILRLDNVLRSKLSYPKRMEASAQPWTQTDDKEEKHSVTLRFKIMSDIDADEVKLAMERPENAEIILNGAKITAEPDGFFTDECIKTLPAGEITKGENTLEITMPFSKKTNLEWCYLLGDFGVQVIGNRCKIVKKPDEVGFSDFAGQLHPFYAGNITYVCNVDLEDGEYALETAKFRAPIVSVSVDGENKGDAFIPPYRALLGRLCGRHKIKITAYGNRINAFGPVHNCDDNVIYCSPNAWRHGGNQFSYEYQLKKTGLLAAPKLYRLV